jgi:hypothetical protein
MSRHVPFVLLFAVAALTAACKPSTPMVEAPAVAVEVKADSATLAAPLQTQVAEAAPRSTVALPPEACTLKGGWSFFRQFVASGDVRRAYSKLDLKAGITAADAAAHPEFDGFRIGLVDNRWVLVDPALEVADYPRVELKSALDGDTFTVKYTKARFSNDDEIVKPYGETAGYTFEFIDGCWMLVGQMPAR